jgi:protein TonB
MPYKFFDNLLDSKRGGRTKRKLTLPVSIGIHVVVLGAVLLVPLLTFSELPDPVMSSAIRAYLVEAAPAPPPPPPPPPPPAASAPKPVTQPKVEQPKPVVEEPKFTAPIEIPKEIPKPEPATGLDSGPGEPGGEIGGVQGGVKGGTQGGVVGGTIGGVPGGELAASSVASPAASRKKSLLPRRPDRFAWAARSRPPASLTTWRPSTRPWPSRRASRAPSSSRPRSAAGGRVTDVKVLRGIPLLDNSAVDAVKQWHYSPTLLNGTPVPVVMTVTVNFRLNGDGRSTSSPAKAAAPAPEAAAPPAEAPAPETAPTPPPQ